MMETILGSTLEEALNNPSLFPSNFDPIRYKQQFNEAVRIMHENGIYHRDLFTKNLMIDQNGDFVLIDFGMSIDTKKTPTNDPYIFERKGQGPINYPRDTTNTYSRRI